MDLGGYGVTKPSSSTLSGPTVHGNSLRCGVIRGVKSGLFQEGVDWELEGAIHILVDSHCHTVRPVFANGKLFGMHAIWLNGVSLRDPF